MNKKELIEKYEYLNHDCFRRVDTSEVLKDLKQLDEPEFEHKKVKIPQFVADWIEQCKAKRKRLLTALLYTPEKVNSWVDNPDNQKLFARAYLDGYEVEKEKRYLVKVKGICGNHETLNREKRSNKWLFSNREENSLYGTHHTRKQLEDGGFGEVFNSTLFEIEEVE